jgi:hypothetical protein
MTPQVFSAFSFIASKGTCMVVDVQGVGDLYTDPQLHSLDGRFGSADLGARGMALFFATFFPNSLCDLLQIPPFARSIKEKRRLEILHMAAANDAVGDTRKYILNILSSNFFEKFISFFLTPFVSSCSCTVDISLQRTTNVLNSKLIL